MLPKSRIESFDFNSPLISNSQQPLSIRRFNCHGGWHVRRPKWRSLVSQSGQNEDAFELKELVDELHGSVDWEEVYIYIYMNIYNIYLHYINLCIVFDIVYLRCCMHHRTNAGWPPCARKVNHPIILQIPRSKGRAPQRPRKAPRVCCKQANPATV